MPRILQADDADFLSLEYVDIIKFQNLTQKYRLKVNISTKQNLTPFHASRLMGEKVKKKKS